jgi:hypothetical protein
VGNDEIYRVAFDSANSELNEISAAVEKLRVRKVQLEKLIVVLGPFLGIENKPDSVTLQASSHSAVPASSSTQIRSEVAGDKPADPFQRRIDHVLGIGSGIRDVRKYTRQF